MRSPRGLLLPVLIVAIVSALAISTTALGTVSVNKRVLTSPEQSGSQALLSGTRVALNIQVELGTDAGHGLASVKDVVTDELLWNPGPWNTGIEDIDGDWIAYRTGGFGEFIYLYNLVTQQQWTVSDDFEGMFMHSVHISGNRAVWVDGAVFDGSQYTKVLKNMDLTTGVVVAEGAFEANDLAFEGNKVLYASSETTDSDLMMYDLDTNETSVFVGESGPQWRPDIRNGLVTWLDCRNVWAIYTKPIGGSEQRVVVGDHVSSWTKPVIGDKLLTWTNYGNPGTNEEQVWTRDLQTGAVSEIASGTGGEMYPSTDGNRIAYTDATTQPAKLFVADISVLPPKITKLGAPNAVRAGVQGKFSATVSNPDANDAQTVVWDWGDGAKDSAQLTGGGKVNMTHAYSVTGTRTLTVTVTDASGISVARSTAVKVK